MPQALLPIFPEEATLITDILSFSKRDGKVWYFQGCMPVFSHDENDIASFNMFTSQLVVIGQCRQVDIVKAFGVSEISLKRHVKRYRAEGASAFFKRRKGKRPTVWTPMTLNRAQELFNEGMTRNEVADLLDIKRDTLYRAVRSGQLVEHKKKLESKSERSIENAEAGMGMGCTRVVERVLASMGKLSSAPSRFKEALDVSHGGVLWALPALLNNGLLRHTNSHFSLPSGFYSVIHVFLLLAFMALARIKTNEKLRYKPAGDLGILLGLDRIPEVRTLRAKIKCLSEAEQVKEWASILSKEWMDADPKAAGTLYVDGHVRVYHGSQTKLPRRYISRERLCLRGMSDYWVNDQQGRPFFVISTPFTSGLLDMLRNEIVPRLLRDVPCQPTQQELNADPHLHRFTLVFDREGYSPVFFREMWEKHRVACMTYKKYPGEDWPTEEFHEHIGLGPHGENIKINIAERGVLIGEKGKGLWVRELRKLNLSGHQTSLVSTEYQAESCALGIRMFSRWCQENFFRYMMEHFNLDALMDYDVERTDETKQIINPAYRKIEGLIKNKAGKLGRKLREFAEITLSPVPDYKEIEKYERRKGDLVEQIDLIKTELVQLKATRKQTQKHVPLGALPETDRFTQLAYARKAFIDTVKMIAYRAETAMVAMLRESMARPGDARALLREIYTTDADIYPDEEQKLLTVRLHHLTNRISDQAAKHLAEHLNSTETIYPGTNLRLRYELVSG